MCKRYACAARAGGGLQRPGRHAGAAAAEPGRVLGGGDQRHGVADAAAPPPQAAAPDRTHAVLMRAGPRAQCSQHASPGPAASSDGAAAARRRRAPKTLQAEARLIVGPALSLMRACPPSRQVYTSQPATACQTYCCQPPPAVPALHRRCTAGFARQRLRCLALTPAGSPPPPPLSSGSAAASRQRWSQPVASPARSAICTYLRLCAPAAGAARFNQRPPSLPSVWALAGRGRARVLLSQCRAVYIGNPPPWKHTAPCLAEPPALQARRRGRPTGAGRCFAAAPA